MKKIVLQLSVLTTLGLVSCTSNEMAKKFGGTITLNLPGGQKLINVTWKEEDIWYLTKPMIPTDVVEIYTFKEQSNYGLQQGTIIIKESK